MLNSVQGKAISRLSNRLQRLSEDSFRLGAVLVHQLALGDGLPLPPQLEFEFNGTKFGGLSGTRADVLIPTKFTRNKGDVILETGVRDFPADGHNFLSFSSIAKSQSEFDRLNPKLENFWGIANELGRLIVPMIADLKSNHGLWQIWSVIDPGFCGRDVWIDYVFEVGWLAPANIPFSAEQRVFWKGASYPLKSCNRIISQLNATRSEAVPEIPKPISTWYSEIEDVVSASQYALDFLLSALAQTDWDDADSTDSQSPDKMTSDHDDRLLVSLDDIDSILHGVKAITLKKDKTVKWPIAVHAPQGKKHYYRYSDIRAAISKSGRKDKKVLLNQLVPSESRARSLLHSQKQGVKDS